MTQARLFEVVGYFELLRTLTRHKCFLNLFVARSLSQKAYGRIAHGNDQETFKFSPHGIISPWILPNTEHRVVHAIFSIRSVAQDRKGYGKEQFRIPVVGLPEIE